MGHFVQDDRGSATRWFALAVAVLSVAGMAGAHTLNWLSQSGHVALVAYRAPSPLVDPRVAADAGVDPMPTGSVPSTSLMIRLR